MSNIIECPACSTRYKMNKPVPEGGRSVKCARCGHQWRMMPEEPEELIETLDEEPGADAFAPAAGNPRLAAELAEGTDRFGHAAPGGDFAERVARYEQAAADPDFSQDDSAFEDDPAFEGDPAFEDDRGYDQADHAAAFGHAASEYEPSAGGYEQAASPAGFSESEGYEEAAAEDRTAPSWEVRRGNLAAALASMSEQIDPAGDNMYDASGAEYGSPAGEDMAETPQWSPRDMAGEAPGGTFPRMHMSPDPELATPAPSFLTGFGREQDDAGWGIEETAAPAASVADAEKSVRDVLRAAFDEQDGSNQGPAVDSSISRPVFTDPDTEEAGGDPRGDWTATGAKAEDYGPAAGAGDRVDVSRQAFSDRWATFTASDRGTGAEGAEAAPSGEAPQDTEKFENDIAGIFRQQIQAKRSFGHAPRGKPAGSSFTDYDMESGHGSAAAADDRYMAESPLDADAAALQAALEGSLRERHAEESRSGAGGLALAAAWAVFLSVLTGVTLAFVNFREDIVAALPGMGALYHTVGLGVEEQQIDFGKVNYRWTVADGKPMIEVTGQIINKTDREIPVPRVLINVRDKENTDPVKATATLRSDPLGAGETADFTLEFISPSKSISHIELAFAERTN